MYQNKRSVYFIYLIADILLIGLSFYLPYCFKYNSNLLPNNLPNFTDYCLLFLIWGVSLVFLLNNHHLYSTERSLTFLSETRKVIKCVAFASALAVLAIFILQMKFFSRLIFSQAIMLLVLSLSLWRIIKRIFIRQRILKGYYNINILIAGAGRAGYSLAEQINNSPYLGLKVMGFLDDHKQGKILNYNILGKLDELEEVVRKYFIDEIYVTIPSERKIVSEILAFGKKLKKTVRILADNFIPLQSLSQEKGEMSLAGFSFPFSRVRLNYIGFIPLISYIEPGPHGTEIFIKRLLDVLAASVALIMLVPLFVIIAFLIKLDGPGAVFYESLRCGRKGELFNFYKFRSMIKDADMHKEGLRHKSEVKGPIFKIKSDPRITPFGRFLRKYSLDELPQLINVLKGDMSLVGPRPPTPDEVAKYDSWQMRRLEIKPGITCLWQVRGRSDLSFYKWVKWDLWYIDNWSLGLDLMILLWTIPAVFKRKGAY